MRSSAIFLVTSLSVAIAKPVGLPDLPILQDPSLASLFPGSENFGNMGDIALGVLDGPSPTPDNNAINLFEKAPAQVASSTDPDTSSFSQYLGLGFGPFSDNSPPQMFENDLLLANHFVIDWASSQTFEVVGVSHKNGNYYLDYPDYDGGEVSKVCPEDQLGCCNKYESVEKRIKNGEGVPITIDCSRCMFPTTRRFGVGC